MGKVNQRAFVAAMAAKYSHRLRRFLSGKTRNAADVPDLAQEVFLRLLRVQDHQVIRSPEAYLFTVASHVLHQHAMRQAKLPALVDIAEVFSELDALSEDDPAGRAARQGRMEDLERTLAQLPVRLSTALLLHRYGGYSIEEIGNKLGIARPTAKKYIAQALTHCRNRRGSFE